MSDETTPPPLRLKPRERPEAGTPPAAAAETDGGKFRLKPKLSVDSPAPVAPPAPAPAAPGPPPSPPGGERIRLKPKLNVEPAQAAAPSVEKPAAPEAEDPAPPEPLAPEEGKIKIKLKITGTVPETTAPPAGETDEDNSVPPPFPMVPDPASGEAGEAVAIPAAILPRPGAPRPGAPTAKKKPDVTARLAAAERRKKLVKYVLIAVVGVVLAAGVIMLAQYKIAEPPATPGIPTRPKPSPIAATPAPKPPAPAPVVEPPAAEEVPSEPVPVEPVRVKLPPAKSSSAKATTQLSPGITITTDAVEAMPDASSAFRAFVANAKISGVFQGNPPRAFINGRLIRAGETIDSSLGIRFESVDQQEKNIVFKDTSGATVSRHY